MRQFVNFFLDLDNLDSAGVQYMAKWGITLFLSLAAAAFPLLLLWSGLHLLG